MGANAIKAKNTAPKRVNFEIILSRYSTVDEPGRTPVINPPFFLILSDNS